MLGGGGVSTPLHAMYILGAHNSKRKLFYIANPSAYYFYVKTIISVDFQIFISVYTIDILYCIWNFFFENIKGISKKVRVMSCITTINFCMSHTWTLINFWHIFIVIFYEKCFNLLPHFEFFRIYKRGLKVWLSPSKKLFLFASMITLQKWWKMLLISF